MGRQALGRKRKQGVARTPKGRISRALANMQDNAEPIAVRMRMFGLTEPQARDQKAATFVGRLCLMGTRTGGISDGQYDAALEYKLQNDAYRRAISAPDSLANATRSGGEGDPDEHVRWCRVVTAKFKASERIVSAEQCTIDNRGRNLFAALDYLVLRDQQFSHMIGDLRIALNARVRHYGVKA
jgi:hypothetical protein